MYWYIATLLNTELESTLVVALSGSPRDVFMMTLTVIGEPNNNFKGIYVWYLTYETCSPLCRTTKIMSSCNGLSGHVLPEFFTDWRFSWKLTGRLSQASFRIRSLQRTRNYSRNYSRMISSSHSNFTNLENLWQVLGDTVWKNYCGECQGLVVYAWLSTYSSIPSKILRSQTFRNPKSSKPSITISCFKRLARSSRKLVSPNSWVNHHTSQTVISLWLLCVPYMLTSF